MSVSDSSGQVQRAVLRAKRSGSAAPGTSQAGSRRQPRPGTLFSNISFMPAHLLHDGRPARPCSALVFILRGAPEDAALHGAGRPGCPCCLQRCSSICCVHRGRSVTNSWKNAPVVAPAGSRSVASSLRQVVGLGHGSCSAACRRPCGPHGRQVDGWRSWRTGPGWSRCWRRPSPGGCAAPGPGGSAR